MEQHWAGTFTQMSPPPRSDSQAYPSSHSDLGPSTQKCPSTQKWPSPAFVSQGDPSSHSDLGPSSSNASVTISELEELSGKPKEPGTRIACKRCRRVRRACNIPQSSNTCTLCMAANERCEMPDLVPESKGEGEFHALRCLGNMNTRSDLQAFRDRMEPTRPGRPPGFVGTGQQSRRAKRAVHSHGHNASGRGQEQALAFPPIEYKYYVPKVDLPRCEAFVSAPAHISPPSVSALGHASPREPANWKWPDYPPRCSGAALFQTGYAVEIAAFNDPSTLLTAPIARAMTQGKMKSTPRPSLRGLKIPQTRDPPSKSYPMFW